MQKRVSIIDQGFDPEAEISIFRRTLQVAGAVVSFTGQVRPSGDDGSVQCLHLQHYPGMTERGIESMLDDADRKTSCREGG